MVKTIIFSVFVVFAINSIVFWVEKRKEFQHSFLPLCVNISVVIIVVIDPPKDYNKSYFKGSYRLGNYQKTECSYKLYIETYCVFKNGYMTTDMNSMYFTDSLNFRKYLGTYSEDDIRFDVKCKGDSVLVEKPYQFYKTDQKAYSLKELIQSHVFE